MINFNECRFCRLPMDNSSTTHDGSWYGRANITTHHSECPKCGSYMRRGNDYNSFQSKPKGIKLASEDTLIKLKGEFERLKIYDECAIKESKYEIFQELAYSRDPWRVDNKEDIIVGISELNANLVIAYLNSYISKEKLFLYIRKLIDKIPFHWIKKREYGYDNTVNYENMEEFWYDRKYLELFNDFMIDYIYHYVMIEDNLIDLKEG